MPANQLLIAGMARSYKKHFHFTVLFAASTR